MLTSCHLLGFGESRKSRAQDGPCLVERRTSTTIFSRVSHSDLHVVAELSFQIALLILDCQAYCCAGYRSVGDEDEPAVSLLSFPSTAFF